MTTEKPWQPSRFTIIAYGALFVGLAAFVVTKETGVLPSHTVKRGFSILLALILVVTGNYIPKLLHPNSIGDSAASRQRRSGWGLVITGLILVAVLVIVPDQLIEPVGGAIGMIGVWIVFIDAIIPILSEAQMPESPIPPKALKSHSEARITALYIIHAIGWVFAMFLASHLWGDEANVWMVVAFVVANSLLAVRLSPAALARSSS